MGLEGETTKPLFDWTTSFHKGATSVPNWSKAFATPPLWTELCPLWTSQLNYISPWIELCNFYISPRLNYASLRLNYASPRLNYTSPLLNYAFLRFYNDSSRCNPALPGRSKTLSWRNYATSRLNYAIPRLSPILFPPFLSSGPWWVRNREYWMTYSGPGFLAVVWFGSPPTPPHPLPSVDRRHTGSLKKRDNLLTGYGWGRSQIIRPQESLVLYKSFKTLWSYSFKTANEKRKQTESLLLISSVQYTACLFLSACICKNCPVKIYLPDWEIFCSVFFPHFPRHPWGRKAARVEHCNVCFP